MTKMLRVRDDKRSPPGPPLCLPELPSTAQHRDFGAPVTFTANLSGGTANITPVYNWTVSAGTIISGQGTPSIQVDTTGLGGQPVTANLSVEGYNLTCPANCTVQVPRKISSTLVDYYPPIRLNDEKARLDNFAIQLQNDPNAKGYVVVYGGTKAKPAEKQGRIKRAYDYLVNTRGISSDRIVTMEGGMRDVTTTELWIVPLGADPPSSVTFPKVRRTFDNSPPFFWVKLDNEPSPVTGRLVISCRPYDSIFTLCFPAINCCGFSISSPHGTKRLTFFKQLLKQPFPSNFLILTPAPAFLQPSGVSATY